MVTSGEKFNNSKTNRVNPIYLYTYIYIYILNHLFDTNPMVTNIAGFNKFENMMTSFPVFNAFPFLCVARPI